MTEAIHSMGGGNTIFRDLGFPEDEAQALLLRGDLAIQIRKVIDQLGITLAEVSLCSGVRLPRMNAFFSSSNHNSH